MNSNGDVFQPQEIAARSRSREFHHGPRVESPSAKRREGLSPYSQSSRARDLQNSGLALLKKTTALLKNPPAVSNYKALNFELEGMEQAQAAEQMQQFQESSKAFESNASRKGVILNLYRKNSGAGSLQERESEYRRLQD
jgi:hypothetical protein